MDEEKFIKTNEKYLDIAKQVSDSMYDICKFEEEISLDTFLSGMGIGIYIFFRFLASQLTDKEVSVKAADLYNEFHRWVKWANSKYV